MDFHINIKKLSFSYGSSNILDDISLGINKGSFTSIIGPNGSGKSTLLKLITSVLKAQAGTIELDGRSISKMRKKEIAGKLSVVPQNTALEFDFKVVDVVLMGRYPFISRFKGETLEDYEIAERYMTYTNTIQLSDRSFMELSGGEKQRVILAQALTQEPEVLILDEPISHLDLQHQVELLNLIRKMCVDKGLTVIAVLHDLNMASAYSDYIVMLKDRKVKYSGTPVEVLNSAAIKEVFNTDVYVALSGLGKKPYIYTLTKPHIESRNKRIHVICGGGSGSELIKELYLSGYELSSGVLAIGDQDWKISKECEMDVAEEIPFVPINEEAYISNIELMRKADYIILTDLYFGKANIRNLEVLLEEEVKSKKLYIIGDATFAERDYTEGQAEEMYKKIRLNPRAVLLEREQLLDELERQAEYEKNI
ncbi:MAG: ABC transporter ATP-binding protein [Bacillota bacterium]